MLQPLVIGLGRSGAGLHLKALSKTASSPEGPRFTGPPIACDPRPEAGRDLRGVTVVLSIAEASRLVPPSSAVVHVCTPPLSRIPVLTELAERGFRRFLVEKPLAADRTELDAIVRLRRQYGLDLAVVSHWRHSELTRRLCRLVQERTFGALVSVSVAQHKPRFLRSLTTEGHPTAFDVEIPHSLGVVLDLAGPAELLDAHWSDMHCSDGENGNSIVRPRMGGARLILAHSSGVRTTITSRLTSPVQQRSITLRFEHGCATGHYPLSEKDDHAHLVVAGAGRRHHIFRDDALTVFMRRTYEDFHDGRRADFSSHHEATRLLCEAKDHCRAAEGPSAGDGHAR
ncbi:Gfo/Idh/MocA family protein [Streptomyces sp. 8N616]|uniref:Gfo/Idh/MocA family protein n=1 Tax=Streptomyces sp. 8N616 TaxID=3457414 RepID=UPI003FD366F9